LISDSTFLCVIAINPALCLVSVAFKCPPFTESPFACLRCYLLQRGFQRTSSEGITPPSSLILAHAPDQNHLAASDLTLHSKSLQVVASPCWEMAFPDVISANLSLRARTPTPAALVVHSPVSSHKTSAFPEMSSGRRFRKYPCFSNFSMGDFSRLQLFDHLPARRFARHPGCSHRSTFRYWAAVAFTSPPISVRYLPEQGIC
jgi:hypothetical protein